MLTKYNQGFSIAKGRFINVSPADYVERFTFGYKKMTEILNSFNETNYYAKFKQIRNKFRKYDSLSIINFCIYYLHHPTKDNYYESCKYPWFLLLLMKWIFIDDEYSLRGRKNITENKFHEILDMLIKLGDQTRLPSEYKDLSLFIRNIIFQQIDKYQRQVDFESCIPRQYIMYGYLEKDSIINKIFRDATGCDILNFLELCIALLCRFYYQGKTDVSLTWFSPLHDKHKKQAASFLDSISVPFDEIRGRLLEKYNHRRRSSLEYYEHSPFFDFPLVKRKEDYICVYNKLFYKFIEYCIYDKLKAWDAQKFMHEFGKIFERYIEKTIKYTGLTYTTEQQLKKLQINKDKKKLIDFIVHDHGSNIFIDAKAVEMPYKNKITYNSEIIENSVKDSVIKAVEQAHDVLNQIKSGNIKFPSQEGKDNYLIVITYKELYLGDAVSFYENIAKDTINKIYNLYKFHIDTRNIHFMTVEDFDNLAELIKKGKMRLSEALEKVKTANKKPETKQIDFKSHLLSWGEPMSPPSYILEKNEELINNIKMMFNNSQSCQI